MNKRQKTLTESLEAVYIHTSSLLNDKKIRLNINENSSIKPVSILDTG